VIAALSELIARGGYMGIVLLTFLETIFPPLPSELFMPMAGYVASRGTLTLPGVIAAGTLGSLAGAWFWYVVGRAIGLDRARQLASRYGRWLTVQPRDIDRSHAWFDRHGGAVVLFGRMMPAIRSLISIPAGVAHMPPGRFLALTTLGTAIWTSVLMTAGFMLGADYGRIAIWAEPFSSVVVAALIGIYIVRLIRFRPD
jgi:membrane protein DedA with SNARE-associated domain